MTADPQISLSDGVVTLRPWRPADAPAVQAAHAWDLDRDGRPLDAMFYVRLRDRSEPEGSRPGAG